MKSLMIKAAKESGKLLMKHHGKIKFIKVKDEDSYVTNVDLESDKLITSMIRKKFPEHNIISEESGITNKHSDYTWYIDPIDGTHNYIANIQLFGVSIALAYKGHVKLGAINLPYFKELYFAEKGKGAYVNGNKLKVSDRSDIKKAFIVTDFSLRYNFKESSRIINNLKDHIYDLRAFGCAVYQYTLVAKGSADGYITSYTNSWDAAAGALIVEESNGKVTDIKGNPWNPEQNNYLSSNKKLHDKLIKILR